MFTDDPGRELALARLIVHVADDHAELENKATEADPFTKVSVIGQITIRLGTLQGLVSAYLLLHEVDQARAYPVDDDLRNAVVGRCRNIVARAHNATE